MPLRVYVLICMSEETKRYELCCHILKTVCLLLSIVLKLLMSKFVKIVYGYTIVCEMLCTDCCVFYCINSTYAFRG